MKRINKRREYLYAVVLVISSVSLFLLGIEALGRLTVDPVDYLKPVLLRDDILGRKIKGHSASHDAWGFRNQSVPSTADVVAIGDSQTYGLAALAKHSWPAALQRLSGKTVYNMALLGYGPSQYFYLLQEKALSLHPSLVVVGFYLGNDISDSYSWIYQSDYWSEYRDPKVTLDRSDLNKKNRYTTRNDDSRLLFSAVRDWLGHHSLLYRYTVHSVLGEFVRNLDMKRKGQSNQLTRLIDKQNNIKTVFTPLVRLKKLDLKKAQIQEGMRLSLKFFSEMNEFCKKQNIPFLALLIPTKESVYAKYIENNKALANSSVIDEFLLNERQARDQITSYFNKHDIAFVDALDNLRNAVGKEPIYPSNYESHPNKTGYSIIAQSVQEYLSQGSLHP